MTKSSNLKGFEKLFPDTIINAIESLDYIPDKRILLLNSFENRVYRVGIENKSPIIAKFYRENRWTNETIQEEHQFTLELKNSDQNTSEVISFISSIENSTRGISR